MFPTLRASAKTRREYLTKLYESLNAFVAGYSGAALTALPSSTSTYHLRIAKETMDLKRFIRLPYASNYLWDTQENTFTPLSHVPVDLASSNVLA